MLTYNIYKIIIDKFKNIIYIEIIIKRKNKIIETFAIF